MLNTLNDFPWKNENIMMMWERCISEVYISRIFTSNAYNFLASDWWRRVMHINEWYNLLYSCYTHTYILIPSVFLTTQVFISTSM